MWATCRVSTTKSKPSWMRLKCAFGNYGDLAKALWLSWCAAFDYSIGWTWLGIKVLGVPSSYVPRSGHGLFFLNNRETQKCQMNISIVFCRCDVSVLCEMWIMYLRRLALGKLVKCVKINTCHRHWNAQTYAPRIINGLETSTYIFCLWVVDARLRFSPRNSPNTLFKGGLDLIIHAKHVLCLLFCANRISDQSIYTSFFLVLMHTQSYFPKRTHTPPSTPLPPPTPTTTHHLHISRCQINSVHTTHVSVLCVLHPMYTLAYFGFRGKFVQWKPIKSCT